MESNFTSLGSSLKVPLVQQLAKQKIATVPPRYVRTPDHHHLLLSSTLTQIPVIDMQRLFDPNFMDYELQELHAACKEWGFFQLINHGVNPSVIGAIKLEIQEFFNLPIEEKNKFCQEAGDGEGYGQAFVVSEEQKLDWADIFYLLTLPTYLRKPRLIPKLPCRFRDAIEAYAEQVQVLGMKILKLMTKALGMKCEEMETLFEQGRQSIRMNYYPPCPQPELVTGLCPHSDGNALTLLLQVNDIQGLQVKKDGNWVPVSPLPDAFIINIGDILEIVTNGTYPSIEHRATVNAEKERLSIATFISPNMDAQVGPAPSLITPQNPAKFRTTGVADFLKGYLARELKGKSYVDTMRL